MVLVCSHQVGHPQTVSLYANELGVLHPLRSSPERVAKAKNEDQSRLEGRIPDIHILQTDKQSLRLVGNSINTNMDTQCACTGAISKGACVLCQLSDDATCTCLEEDHAACHSMLFVLTVTCAAKQPGSVSSRSLSAV